jgi:hypothetical protein
LRTLEGYTEGLYYDTAVTKAIDNFEEHIAEKTWKTLKAYTNHPYNWGFSIYNCPFCIYFYNEYSNCLGCTYGRIKGICGEKDEKNIIDQIIHSVEKNGIFLDDILDASFYKDLIEKIERKDK